MKNIHLRDIVHVFVHGRLQAASASSLAVGIGPPYIGFLRIACTIEYS